MVAETDRTVQLPDDADALAGLGAVTDDVADLYPVIDADSSDGLHHGLEGFEVAVNVS